MQLSKSIRRWLLATVAFSLLPFGIVATSASPAQAAAGFWDNCGPYKTLGDPEIKTLSCMNKRQTNIFSSPVYKPKVYVQNSSQLWWAIDVDVTVWRASSATGGVPQYVTACHYDVIYPGEFKECSPIFFSGSAATWEQASGTTSAVVNGVVYVQNTTSPAII